PPASPTRHLRANSSSAEATSPVLMWARTAAPTACGSSSGVIGPWWCRVDSNHRQRDYESRALPPELRHRAGPQGFPRNRGEASDFVGSSLTSGLRPRLQLALLLPVLGDRYPLSLVHFLATHTSGRMAWDQVGCGGRIRTDDLRVMSPTSCRCSTPRHQYTQAVAGPPRGGLVPGRRRGTRARRRHEVGLLVRPGESVQPRLLLVGGPVGQRLHVLSVACVLPCNRGVLSPQLRHLLVQPVD